MKGFIFSLLVFFIVGCATGTPKKGVKGGLPQETSRPQTLSLPPKTSLLPELKPIFKEISPFETRRISLSVKDGDAFEIFYLLAREAGLNLVIEREVYDYLSGDRRLVTAEFRDYTLKEILEGICWILDLTYEIRGGVIYIKAFEEKLFDLSFLQTVRGSEFSLGGDVLGGLSGRGGGQEVISPLKGQYELSGSTAEESTDIYAQIETTLPVLLSPDGTFTFNRLTGNLWVRDRPSRVKRISELVQRLKKRYGRQVLIEAKIVEVHLSRGHDLGIDWMRIQETRLPEVSEANLDLRPDMPTLTLTYQYKPSFNLAIKLLETYGEVHILSNPRIRVLHGQPALISVGRSVGYLYLAGLERETDYEGRIVRVTPDITTSAVFDGLLLGVTPHITESEEIILHIVPIKSDLVELKTANIQGFEVGLPIGLPDVDLREMSSVIKVKPRDLVVIGGLILEKKKNETRGVAGLSSIPLLGNLFTHSVKDTQKVELVILLRVSLV